MTGPSERKSSDHNLLATLSLFLLILAFFILLNALSQLETDRTRMVIESVNEAFRGRIVSTRSVAPHPAAVGQLDDGQVLVKTIEQLFQNTIPAVETAVSADASTLRLDLAASALFRRDRVALRRGRELLFERVAEALLDHGKRGRYFEVDLLHGIPAAREATVAEAGGRSLEIGRVSALVRLLEQQGIAPERLAAGILPDQPADVQVQIRIYDEPPPQGDFEALVR